MVVLQGGFYYFKNLIFLINVRPRKSHTNADFLSRVSEQINPKSIDNAFPDAHLFNVDIIPPEYANVIYYLTKGVFFADYSDKQKQRLVFKAQPYTMIGEVLYKKGKDEILRRCINSSEVPLILKGCHDDICGDHFTGMVIAQKVLQAGYWWPTLFSNVAIYACKCDPCQRVGKPVTSSSMSLNPILAQVPFEKWGIDFVDPNKPLSCCGRKHYILVATEYVTKWAEALATKTDDAETVAKFLYEYIIICFGCPKELVIDKGIHFINSTIKH